MPLPRTLAALVTSTAAVLCTTPAVAQADPIAYSATNETAARYHPGATYGNTIYEDVYVYAPGATQARVNSVTIGIGRLSAAPAVDILVSLVQMTWDGTAFKLGSVVASKGVSLPASTAEGTTPVTVSWGDTDPSLRPVVNLHTGTNGMNAYGGFWVAVNFRGTNATNTSNGWKVVNLPTTGRSPNVFGLYNSSTATWGPNFYLGQATGTDGTARDKPARFHLAVRAAAINPVTPPADMQYGHSCADTTTYHPPQAADGLATRWVHANCFVGANSGQEFVPRRVNFGIARNGTAAAPAPEVTLDLALFRMTYSGTAFGRAEMVSSASFPLSAVSTGTRETVTWDIPAGSVRVPLETTSNAGQGGLWVAARFSGPNAADTKNALRIGYLQMKGASLNRFGMEDANGVFVPTYFFGNYDNGSGAAGEEKPARMVAEAYGAVQDPGAACLGDLDLDGSVSGADLGLLLGEWGTCPGNPCLGDLNLDGEVSGADLGLLLGEWGPCQ